MYCSTLLSRESRIFTVIMFFAWGRNFCYLPACKTDGEDKRHKVRGEGRGAVRGEGRGKRAEVQRGREAETEDSSSRAEAGEKGTGFSVPNQNLLSRKKAVEHYVATGTHTRTAGGERERVQTVDQRISLGPLESAVSCLSCCCVAFSPRAGRHSSSACDVAEIQRVLQSRG